MSSHRPGRLGLSLAAIALFGAAFTVGPSPSHAQSNVPAVGEVDQCIPLNRIYRTKAVDNETIVVELRGSDGWRKMETNSRCPGLKLQDSFSYSTSLTQLCKGDIIRVLGSSGASCGLSQITVITEDDAKSLMAKD